MTGSGGADVAADLGKLVTEQSPIGGQLALP
jgi:hypothetical protein